MSAANDSVSSTRVESKMFSARLPVGLIEQIKTQAEQAGISASAYVELALTKRTRWWANKFAGDDVSGSLSSDDKNEIIEAIDRLTDAVNAVDNDLRRIGVNFNQTVTKLNSGEHVSDLGLVLDHAGSSIEKMCKSLDAERETWMGSMYALRSSVRQRASRRKGL